MFMGNLPNCCGTSIPSNRISKASSNSNVLFSVLFSARTNEEIVAIILKGDSKAFDVDVLKAFINILPDNTEVRYQGLNSLCNITALSSR